MADQAWYTDRSRYLDGFFCERYRYLKYHSITGYGIEAKQVSLPLTTGIWVHAPLATILQACKGGTIPSTQEVRSIIQAGVKAYRADVKDRGFLDVGDAHLQRTIEEQACLIEGLLWGYVRCVLPAVLKEFEVLAVEREEFLALGVKDEKFALTFLPHRVRMQSRPDFVARCLQKGSPQYGKLGVHDFKTAASIGDNYIAEYNHSVQMSLATAAVEARLKEPVTHFFVHGLIKGGRGKFKKDGVEQDWLSQYSSLCYAKLIPPMPPLQRQPQWKTSGYWADKQPLWTLPWDFWPDKPKEMSNQEYWVTQVLPLAELQEVFMLIGPYARPDIVLQEALTEMYYNEEAWIAKLWEVHSKPRPFGDEGLQSDLQMYFPRSWRCHEYAGGPCPMIRLCFRQPGWQDPLGSGFYVPRVPHHEAELRQAAERLKANV